MWDRTRESHDNQTNRSIPPTAVAAGCVGVCSHWHAPSNVDGLAAGEAPEAHATSVENQSEGCVGDEDYVCGVLVSSLLQLLHCNVEVDVTTNVLTVKDGRRPGAMEIRNGRMA